MKLALVGDIGGTNARFALWRNEQLESVRVLATADFPGPEAAIQAYLAELELPLGAVDSVCLACAGPVSGDLFRFTNNHWRISRAAFCRELQVRELLLVNDFSAMALGMTRLRDDERLQVCPGTPEAEARSRARQLVAMASRSMVRWLVDMVRGFDRRGRGVKGNLRKRGAALRGIEPTSSA